MPPGTYDNFSVDTGSRLHPSPAPHLLLLLIGVRVDAVRIVEHTVVIHRGAGGSGQLEDLGAAGGGDDGVGGGDGRDDALHHPLRQSVGDPCDAWKECASLRHQMFSFRD